jgi:RNA polymerase sigma-70 factor (ECF subfamily)
MVYRTAFAYFKNKADTEDVVSEVFIKYFTSENHFNNEQHEKAWFIRVTVNRCKDILRSFRVKKTVPLDEASEICETFKEKAVFNAVMELPKNYSLVIHLYYFEGYTSKEIAQICGKSDQTIRTWLSRARKMLKKSLGEEFCI